ncbi:phosphonate metabolism transcriptional regulator PhnF [Roseibium marinum]|uniref:GntR family phosphonate transport system transcriptional regulator n=1 Tax=Roseibium marinum TaxID=281252 RepID=A0A2S3UL83_9HYPH|nr:phosphonate metabolism transcriptional regulator PhnF [Roseibium marinum]POF28313.1 GntR family phosphonate transport system transcriptional regulator [Roseibium marinum]
MTQKLQPITGMALWRHITDKLGDAIDRNELRPGDALPSEHDLMSEYGVSRNTVRRALGRLRELGKIEVSQGKGAFVRSEPLQHTITVRTRFADNLAVEGLDFDVQILSQRKIKANESLAQALDLKTGDPVIYLKALTSVENTPVSYGKIFHPADRFPNIAKARANNSNLAEVYEGFGVKDFIRRVTWISARNPTEEEAQLLRQDAIDPVLLSRKIDVDTEGVPVEFNETVWSARRAQLCLPVSEFARAEDENIRSHVLPD